MADQERTVDQVTSDELFNTALAPEAAPTEPVVPVEPAPEPAPVEPTPEAAIPSWRLREEAEARRLAEDRARTLEARLNEINTRLNQQQQPKPPDFFENPDQATQAAIMRALQPFAEEQRKQQMYLGKMVAEVAHGVDKVTKAEQAFLEARDRQTLDPADYERVVQSPNRYDAVVQWHKRQSVLSSVGDDPAAWFEKQLEARMADPQFQTQLLEKARASAAKRPTAVKLPPSLSGKTSVASSSGDGLGDMSDASLFAFAMKR